jgi:tRNA A-37 threonylcarbamoyl transferase component Bud32
MKNTWHAIKHCLRRSRAWISWGNAHRLAILGIPTPKPIVFLEKRWGPFRSTAYFVTEYVDGIDTYHLFHSDKSKEINQEGLVKQFRELVQLLCDAAISHGDLKATNFIVTSRGLYVTDLDAMREYRLRWRFRRAIKRDCKRLMKNWMDLPEVAKIFRDQLTNLEL